MSITIGFFGSAPFVVNFLEDIHQKTDYKLSFIVTSKDKPKGRGQIIAAPEAKIFALKNGIPCLQPDDIKNPDFLNEIKAYNADIFLVIAYGKKLPANILTMPPKGCYNLHFSILPRWRGAAPVNWAVLAGDRETGVTFMKMDEGLDTGDIVFQKKILIDDNDTTEDVFKKLIFIGRDFLINALDRVEKQNFSLSKQNEALATYAVSFKKEDGLINWNETAINIHNKIRGLQPWPVAFTFLNGKRIKIYKSNVVQHNGEAGKIIKIENDGIIVGTKDAAIKILELQEEGKKRLKASDFLCGKTGLLNTFFDGYGAE